MAETIACKSCGLVHEKPQLRAGYRARCSRCGSTLRHRTAFSLHRTAAFSLAALILYVPANLLPILHMEFYGAVTENTVWDGCVRLFKDGDWAVAAIVFLASMLIPLLKLVGLFTLVSLSWIEHPMAKAFRMWLLRIIEGVGRWAMLDVFVVAVLVSLVKLHKLATVIPGPGLIAFTGVVVLTILASASFDPQLIWEPEEANS